MTAISPEAGNRLAALADGEGCFSILRIKAGRKQDTYYCQFSVKMREDDSPFLVGMKEVVGLGAVKWGRPSNGDGALREAWVRWDIQRKAECRRLCEIFDAYPLWSKKADDYEIWREAVFEWSLITNYSGQPANWSNIAALRDRLQAVRRYNPDWLRELTTAATEDVPSS